MVSPLGFFVHAAWVLGVAGITGAVFYWLVGRVLGRVSGPPGVARHRLDDLPAEREG